MNILRFIISLVVLGVVGLGVLYLAEMRGMVAAGTVAKIVGNFQKSSPAISNTVTPATQFLSSQTSALGQNGSVLGSSIEIEAHKPPIHQRAFEYARYMYCQEVLRDYDRRYQDESTPAPSPSDQPTPSE